MPSGTAGPTPHPDRRVHTRHPLPAPPPSAPPSIDDLATTFGLDPVGAEVVRAASRHVVRFPASAVRTFAVPAGTRAPRDEAAVAALLADAGVPAARRLAGPAPIDGWSVTAWREIAGAEGAAPVDAATVGALAARLHRATGALDRRGLVACDPVGAALAQLEAAAHHGATDADDMDVLRGEATRLEPVWQGAVDRARPETDAGSGEDVAKPPPSWALGPPQGGSLRCCESIVPVAPGAVLHGDLHPGNVVAGRDGPVLVDLELAGWGPCAFDGAPTAAMIRWYGRPETDGTAFDVAYGAPLTAAAREVHLDEVWRLWSTCWAVANRHRSAANEDEAAVRVATLRDGAAPRPWRLR